MVASAPQVLVAHPSFKPSTVAELIAYAKAADKPVIYGSAGVGSPSHIAGELFKKLGQVQLTHAPYRGGGPATVDVLGGQIPLLWVSLPAVTQYIRNGKLKALAVSTKERTPVVPDVPSMPKPLTVSMWIPGMPCSRRLARRDQSSTKFRKCWQTPPAIKPYSRLSWPSAVAVGGTPQALEAVVKKEIPAWKTLAKEANIKIN